MSYRVYSQLAMPNSISPSVRINIFKRVGLNNVHYLNMCVKYVHIKMIKHFI